MAGSQADKRSPAHRVHDDDDLRREIAGHLDFIELAKYGARISRPWLKTVAGELYRNVPLTTFMDLYTHPDDSKFKHDTIYLDAMRNLAAEEESELHRCLPIVLKCKRVQKLSCSGIVMDLRRKIIHMVHCVEVDGLNPRKIGPPDISIWPKGFDFVFLLGVCIESADQSPADCLQTLLPSNYGSFSSLRLQDPKDSRESYECQLQELLLSLDDAPRPSWWKEIFTLRDLKTIRLKGRGAHRITAKDIVQVVKSEQLQLEGFCIRPDLGSLNPNTMDDVLGTMPKITQLTQLLRIVSSNELRNLSMDLTSDLDMAQEFSRRAYAEASGNSGKSRPVHRSSAGHKREFFLRIHPELTIGTEADRVNEIRHLVLGYKQLQSVDYLADADIKFVFHFEEDTSLFENLLREYEMRMGN